MTVYDSGDWFKCKKEIIRDENISRSAKWLYIVLAYKIIMMSFRC